MPARASEAQELAGLRTVNSRTYARPDGTRVAEIAPVPLHFRNGAGDWQPIEADLVAASAPGYALRTRADSAIAQLPSRLGAAPVRISSGDFWISFALQGAGPAPAARSGPAGARYGDVLPGVDVDYHALPGLLKEDLVLASADSPRSFTYRLQLGPGLEAAARPDGAVAITDARDTVRFLLAAPYAEDARGGPGASTRAVAVDLRRDSGAYELTYSIDADWLAAPERRFPVRLDPTVLYEAYLTINAAGWDSDCYITNGAWHDTSLCFGDRNYVAFDGTLTSRTLLRFLLNQPVSGHPPVPSSAQVLNATLLARPTSTIPSGLVNVYRVTQAQQWGINATWEEWSQSTNPDDYDNPWDTPGGSPASEVAAEGGQMRADGWYQWAPTQLVQSWVSQATPNNGVVLRLANETTPAGAAFYSSQDTGGRWPVLWVYYRNTRVGAYPSDTFVSEQLSDRSTAQVNVATGNLMLTSSDLEIAGTGLDLDITRTFNRRSEEFGGTLGLRWMLDTAVDMNLTVFEDGNVVVFGPGGWAASLVRRPDGSYISPRDLPATLVSDAQGTGTLTYNDSGLVYGFSGGTLAYLRDRNGNQISYTVVPGPNGTPVLDKITDTQGRQLVATRDGAGRILTLTDAAGRQISYRYNATGRLDRFTDAAGNHTTYAYDATFGDLTTITDPLGHETRIAYTGVAERRVASISRVLDPTGPVLATTTFSYSTDVSSCPATGDPATTSIGKTTVTDPTGHPTVYCWDQAGRTTKLSDATGYATTSSWTTANTPAQVTTPGGTATNTYDSTGLRLTSTTDPAGATTAFAYGAPTAPYSPTQTTDPQGKTRYFAYDGAGNQCLIRTDRAPSGCADDVSAFARLVYNANGTLASATDANGHTTIYGYDAAGNLTSATPPAPLGAESRTYDTLSRLKTETDGKGQTTTYTYDALDRVTRIDYHDGAHVAYAYDAAGNRLTQTDAGGTTTSTYDRANRLITETPPSGPAVSYGYDTSDNLVSITDGGGTVTYQYADAAGRLTSLTQPGGAQISFGYDANANRNKITYPNGVVVDSGYDGARKPLGLSAHLGPLTTLSGFIYNYTDPAGRKTNARQSETEVDGSGTHYTYYTYDGLGRLTWARTTDTGGAQTADYQYYYDPAGNRIAQIINGTPTGFGYNAANQLIQAGALTYGYDANGNLTGTSAGLSATYNALDQTTQITPPGGPAIAMAYRGKGQTERTQVGSTALRLSSLGVAGTSEPSGDVHYTRTPDGELLAQRTASGTNYYLTDALGSVVAITDGSGAVVARYAYDPFGQPTLATGSVANPWRFAGEYLDQATGLYKIGARYYDPATGRWTQQDPIVDHADPVQANRYLYVGADPVNVTDPTGMTCKLVTRIKGRKLRFNPKTRLPVSIPIWEMYTDCKSTPVMRYVRAAVRGAASAGRLVFSPTGRAVAGCATLAVAVSAWADRFFDRPGPGFVAGCIIGASVSNIDYYLR